MAVKYERKTVTPRMAKAWLGKNIEINRREKKGKIPGYVRDMKAGDWQVDTGETIKFDVDGQLIDGQNRLKAVVLADVPIDFDVAYGCPTKAFAVIDSGSARTASDSLSITAAMSSILRWSVMWHRGNFLGAGGSYKPTTSEMGEAYLAEEKLFDSAESRGRDCSPRGLGSPRVTGMAHYLFSRLDVEATHAFYDQYISGADLPGRSPVLALRNRMARIRVDRLSPPEQLALFIRAWNHVRTDTPTDRLLISRHPLTNENFPQPK